MADVKPKTALVTGATGFVGRHVVPVLRRNGWRTRLALHHPDPASVDCSVVTGSISSDTDWGEALRGIDAVVHLAARVHRSPAVQQAERELYWEINTNATLQLARAAAEVGVKSFFFMSSIAVNGSSTEGRPAFRENDLPAPETIYAESKARAEEHLAELSMRSSMRIVVARPPLVYGRGARGNFSLLARAVRAGIPLPFGSIANRRAFIAAANLADFVLHSLSVDGVAYETYIVADDQQVSTPDFIRHIAYALGCKSRLLPMPKSALKLLARVSHHPEVFNSLCNSLEVDVQKVHAFGWRPPLTLDQGLIAAVKNNDML